MRFFSFRRLFALCNKEVRQIIRDPSSMIIAVIIPLMLLLIFGYGINLDSGKIRVGVIVDQNSAEASGFIQTLYGSPFIKPIVSSNRQYLIDKIQGGDIRGIIHIPSDFSQKVQEKDFNIQLVTDGSEPNIANFVQGYIMGAWQVWQLQRIQDEGIDIINPLDIEYRYWFNPAAISRNFIIPGAITIIMTIIGSILTSLVIAREWERGTMESLLATPMTRLELLLSKLFPYYCLGMIAMIVCVLFSVMVMHVPFRGSFWILLGISSLFLFSVLGIGLLVSTITRNQFNAAMVAINVAFLPAVMLSGFVFEINSMPAIIQLVTHIIPARYFVSALKSLFLAGNIPFIIMLNVVFLISAMLIFLALTFFLTKRRLD